MQMIENDERAEQRGKAAHHVQQIERIEHENKENAHLVARQQALDVEKERAAYIAKLPRSVDELESAIAAVTKRPVKAVTMHTSNLFASTRYHMPEALVDKSTPAENVIKSSFTLTNV
jgi:ABC-type Fe3+-hydroxamate transport system substrate-binding protein